MGIALRFLALLLFAVPLHAQTMTIEGHLAPFTIKLTVCDCVPGTQGAVKIELHHYFTTTIGTIYKRQAIYPIGIAPPKSGFKPAEFTANAVTVTIGKDVWRSRYTDPRDQALNFVAWDKRYGEFQSLDGKIFMFRDEPARDDSRPKIALLNLDLRTSNTLSLWNVTGAAIPSGALTSPSRFGLIFGNGERVVFTVDSVSASPIEVAESPNSLRPAPTGTGSGSGSGNQDAPQPPPILPGGGNGFPPASSGARVPANTAASCMAALAEVSAAKVTGELLKLAAANPILAELELDKREVFLTAALLRAPVVCVAGIIANAMAMAANGGGGGNGDSKKLTEGERKKLGALASQADETVGDVIKERGGSGSNLNEVGPWRFRTLREAARAAIDGDQTAEKAIKIAKQAAQKGQNY